MKKSFIILSGLLFVITAFSQKRPNPKIGKNETEITLFVMGDRDFAYGAQFVYRLSLLKKLKVGAGILYGVNEEGNLFVPNTFGYGAVFADASQFLGRRQKWGFGGQIGHGIYNHDVGDLTIKAGLYYSVSCNYRAIISKKVLLNTSLFLGHRNFYSSNGNAEPNSALIGLRCGLVF